MKLTPVDRASAPRNVRYLVQRSNFLLLYNGLGQPRYYWGRLGLPCALNPLWAWLRPRDLRGFALALCVVVVFSCVVALSFWRAVFGVKG